MAESNTVQLIDPPSIPRKGFKDRLSVVKPIQYPDHHKEAMEEVLFKPFKEIVGNESATLLFLEAMRDKEKDATVGTGDNKYPVWKDPQTGKECHARIISVRWITKSKLGESYKKINIKTENFKESFKEKIPISKKLQESDRDKLIEDYFEDFDGGMMTGPNGWPGAGLPGLGTGFLPYPPGPLTHQLYLQDMWQQQAKAFQIYNHFGIAKGIVKMLTAFVIGDGAKVSAVWKDKKAKKNKKAVDDQTKINLVDEAQDFWDEFEERVEFQHRLAMNHEMLCKNGEMFWHMPECKVDGKPGYVDFISKSPGTCWEKITEPDNVRNVHAYYFNYPTRYLIVAKDNLPTTDYIVEMLPPDEMIHTLINVEEDEARGRSDLYASLSDLKMLYDMLKARVVKVMNAAGIIIHHKITGNAADINSIANSRTQSGWNGVGTEVFTSESEEIEVLKGADSENSKSGLHDEVMSAIGTGTTLPADWIGSGGSGSRASALTRTEPAAKQVRRRQKEIEQPIKKAYKRVIQIGKKWGLVDKQCPEDCEITFPEIAPENVKEKLGNIVLAEQQEFITHEMATMMVQKELDITDAPEYEDLMDQIKKDLQDKQLEMAFAPVQMNPDTGQILPPKPGQPGQPGAKGPSSQANPNAAGKAQSKGTYGGDKMGLSNQSKNAVKRSMQARRDANPLLTGQPLLEWAKKGSATHKSTAQHKPKAKKAHRAVHKGLKSGTKHTLKLSEETISAPGALMRGQPKITAKEAKTLAKALKPFEKYLLA